MLGDLLMSNVWLCMAIAAAVYTSDHLLTLLGAKMYKSGVQKHIVLKIGYEVTPYFREDVARLRWFSPRFALALILICSFLWLLKVTTKAEPKVFAFILGGLVFLQAAVHGRHLRNLFIFRYVLASRGIRGRIEQSRWFSLRSSAFECLTFAGVYLLAFFMSHSIFLLGGAAFCFGRCLAEAHWSRREPESDWQEGAPPVGQ